MYTLTNTKNNTTKIYARTIEDGCMEQLQQLVENPAYCDSKVRIMPDCHAGLGSVIGFTATFDDKIIPNTVGVDISCGMEVVNLGKVDIDLPHFDDMVKLKIPSGLMVRDGKACDFKTLEDLHCYRELKDTKRIIRSIGTLGGGNHFIELDYNEEQELMGATVHTGSRNIGQKVCNRWAKKAIATKGYLSGDLLSQYLTDMVVAQAYAQYNRKIILDKIADIYKKLCKGKVTETISSVHNYLDFSDMIIRKGAIRSYVGERMVIPFNMRDGLAICEGKSNADWNCSAPHGAGRLLSRNKAKELLTMEAFREAMSNIYSTSVCEGTLDESPMAYKDTQTILREIEPTCEILYFMKPVVNLKDIC